MGSMSGNGLSALALFAFFHLASTVNSPKTTRILFGSCNKVFHPQPLWPHIVARQPDVWIWGGDSVYADLKKKTLLGTESIPAPAAHLRELYATQKRNPGYAQLLHSPTRIVGTWDDHDYGINDGDQCYPYRNESQALFLDFIGEDMGTKRRQQRGVYTAEYFEFGHKNNSVLVVLLDMRYHRDPYGTPNGDFLGEDQWNWLEQTLAKSTATVHLIMSSLQFFQLRDGIGIGESWPRFPHAKKRMLQTLVRNNVSAPILLSGDVHLAQFNIAKCGEHRLLEVTSSGMTHSWGIYPFTHTLMSLAQYVMPWRYQMRDPVTNVPQYNLGFNFGEFEFDWRNQQVLVTIFGEDGQPHLRQLFPLNGFSVGNKSEGPICIPEGGEPEAWRFTIGIIIMIGIPLLIITMGFTCVVCLFVKIVRRSCKIEKDVDSDSSLESSDDSSYPLTAATTRGTA